VLFIRDVTTQKHNQQKILKLHESSEKLTGADSLNMVWDTAMDTVGKILGFDFSGIAVNEGENFRYVRIIGDEKALDWSFSLQKPSITGKVIKTGLPQYIRDTTLDPEYEKGPGDAPQQSEIALPIKVEDRVVAVLNVEGEYNTLFNDVDINLLEILVGQLSSAATRIMKKEEEVRAKEKHTKDLIEGADRLSSMVRHDLRGPLQTIKAASYLIRKDPERYEDYTQRIDDCVDHANKLLEDLKNVLRPGEFITIPVNLSELAEHCLNDIIIPERISLLKNLETPVIALVDPHRVRRVIDNLVKNAIEAMPEGGKLTVSTEKEGDKAVITITDTGIGIDDVVKKNLFTPFITTKKTGTGLGLAICKRIVEDHGGTIIYDTKKNKGTSFTVTIPIQAEKLPTDKIEEQIPLEIQNTASE
jgi:signal transduction histidine kinase